MYNVHEFNHATEDLCRGNVFEIQSLPIRISTKSSHLKIIIPAFDDRVGLLFMLEETFGFLR